jgi:hypothetical protein
VRCNRPGYHVRELDEQMSQETTSICFLGKVRVQTVKDLCGSGWAPMENSVECI